MTGEVGDPQEQQVHILAAERERTGGEYAMAKGMVRGFVPDALTNFSEQPKAARRNTLAAIQIFVGASISEARNQETAQKAADELREARDVIVRIYDNEDIQQSAQTIRTGLTGSPHEHDREMERQKVLYTRMLAELLDDPGLHEIASNETRRLVELSEEPMTKTLLQFELQRDLYHQTRNEDTFGELSDAFAAVKDASATNKERIATIATRFILDAEDADFDTQTAQAAAREAYDQAISGNDSIANIFDREQKKKMQEEARRARWKDTMPADNEYYKELALPMDLDTLFAYAQKARDNQHIPAALALYQRVRDEALAQGNSLLAAESLHMIGVAYNQDGQSEQADESLRRSEKEFRDAGNEKFVGFVLRDRGLVALRQGTLAVSEGEKHEHLAQAETYLKESAAILKERNPGHYGITLSKLGLVYAEQGNLEKAEETIRGAIEIIKPTSERFFESTAYFDLAKVLKMANKINEAKASASESLRILDTIGGKDRFGRRRIELEKFLDSLQRI